MMRQTAAFAVLLLGSCAADPVVDTPVEAPAGEIFPAFFPGTARISLSVDGVEEPLECAVRGGWRPSTVAPLPGPELGAGESLELSCGRGVAVTLHRWVVAGVPVAGRVDLSAPSWLARRGARLILQLAPRGLERGVVWRRLSHRRDDVVLLALGETLTGLENTIVDPVGGTAIELAPAAGGVRMTASADRPGARPRSVRVEVALQAGRDRPVLEYRSRTLPIAVDGTTSLAAPFDVSGWSLEAGERPTARALLSLASAADRHRAALGGVELATMEIDASGIGADWSGEDDGDPLAARTRSFPDGLRAAIATLGARGFRVILAIQPLGTDHDERVEADATPFLIDRRGEEVDGGALGERVYDPTVPAGREAIEARVRATLHGDSRAVRGLRIARLDAAMDIYRRHAADLRGDGAPRAPSDAAVHALREALRAVREGLGERGEAGPNAPTDSGRLIATDWNAPAAVAGLVELKRPQLAPFRGGDPIGLDPLRLDAIGLVRELPYHRLGWQSEGVPLEAEALDEGGGRWSSDAVRALLSFCAITGRSVSIRGRPREPSAERWAWLRRVLPPADCRPLDLDGAPSIVRLPRVWAVKAPDGPDGAHDVVAFFNWSPFGAERVVIALEDLALDVATPERVVFDRWEERFLCTMRDRLDLTLPPRSCRVVSLHPSTGRPRVVADSRHLVDSARALHDVHWDADARRLRLRLEDGHGAAGELRVHVHVPDPYRLASVRVDGRTAEFAGTGEHATVTIERPEAGTEVVLRFDSSSADPAPVIAPRPAARFDVATGSALIEWEPIDPGAATRLSGHGVRRDGELLGRTSGTRFLAPLPPSRSLPARTTFTVTPLAADGTEMAALAVEVPFEEPVSVERFLDELVPELGDPCPLYPGRNGGPTGLPLVVAGERLERGVGVAVPSTIAYALRGRWRRLQARVGVDASGPLDARVIFRVRADGRQALETPPLRHDERARTIDIDVTGVDRIELTAIAADGSGVERRSLVLAVWGDTRLLP